MASDFSQGSFVNTNGKFLHQKIYKHNYNTSIEKNFVFSINMPNTQQNNIQNEIKQINKEINLLQDRQKNEKSLNQFQNGLIHIRRIRVKKGQRTDLSQTKEMQNIVQDILQNKIKQIEKNTNLPQNILAPAKKRKIIGKRAEENSKNAESFTK